MPQTQRKDERRDAGTLLAVMILLLISAGLVGLAALVMPQIIGLLVVVFGFFCFGAIHYVIWGWWFTSRGDSKAADDRDDALRNGIDGADDFD